MAKSVKKAQVGKGPIKPTYKNLKMGVKNEYEQATGERRDVKATSADSANYRRGFERGLKGGKEYPGERNIEKMGRWEGQNVGKKKMKTGGTLSPSKKSVGKTIGKLNKAKSGSSLGMKSVKAGFDKNPGVTRADFVSIGKGQAKKGAKIGAKKMMGGGKCKYGCK
jgi:hypothetical protein